MSDQAVLLPIGFSHGGILLAKGQLDPSYTFWTRPIMIFSPVANFGNHPLGFLDILETNKTLKNTVSNKES